MLTIEQEEKGREIARDITERAERGEFGYRTGLKEIPVGYPAVAYCKTYISDNDKHFYTLIITDICETMEEAEEKKRIHEKKQPDVNFIIGRITEMGRLETKED